MTNTLQHELEEHFNSREQEVPEHILLAASKLFISKDFKTFMDWWQEQQREYADNVLTSDIASEHELFKKAMYLQGQKAESNLIRLAVVHYNHEFKNKPDKN